MDAYTNIHEFSGKIGGDPELHYFPSGKYIAKFSVAVKPPYSSEEPLWLACQCWNNTADIAANYLEKGKIVGIQAEMKIENWQDKVTGEDRQKPVFMVKRLELLSKKEQEQAHAQ